MTPRHPPRALRSLTTPIRPPHRGRRPDRLEGPRRPDGDDLTRRVRPPDSCRGRGVSRRGAPLLRVTISLSVRVHCCGEKDSATTTLAWLSCLRDQPPNCQRATGRTADRGPGLAPRGSRPTAVPTGRWPGGEAAPRGSAPPRIQRDRDRIDPVDRVASCRLASDEPPGEAGGMVGRSSEEDGADAALSGPAGVGTRDRWPSGRDFPRKSLERR